MDNKAKQFLNCRELVLDSLEIPTYMQTHLLEVVLRRKQPAVLLIV